MIALNTVKGIIEISSWHDIVERPHFRSNINPTNVDLKEIIGSYQFPEDVPCGLTTCHQPHKRGYIVVTKEGYETNIGKDCGKNYFSVDFVEMKTRFDRDVKISLQRDNIRKAKETAPQLLEHVEGLRKQPRGADWIYSRIEKLRNRGVIGEAAANEIRKMLKERRRELLSSRLATKEERERDFSMNPSLEDKYRGQPYYVTIVTGSINHLEAMSKDNDLKELLIRGVTQTLRQLIDCDVDNLKPRELAQLSKDASNIQAKINMAQEIIPLAQKLLTASNLEPLAFWVEEHHGERAAAPFKRFIEQL